jgi:hypothetical protein
MKAKPTKEVDDDTAALLNRRKFLKKALLTVAYVTPVLVSYSSTVFAAHCTEVMCGGADHMGTAGMLWSPGCSRLV